jgi:hypothetical protein
MGVIYMSHSVHGAKVATMELEALEDEKNGWVRYTLDTPSVEEQAAPVVKRHWKLNVVVADHCRGGHN